MEAQPVLARAIEELARSFAGIAESIDRLTEAYVAGSKMQSRSMDAMLELQRREAGRTP